MVTEADDAQAMQAIAVSALETVRDLTRTSPDKALDALLTIGAIAESLLEGFAGKTTPDVVAAEFKALTDRISAPDTHAKFDPGGDS